MRFSMKARLVALPLIAVALLLGLCVSFSGRTHAASAIVSAPYNNVGITDSTDNASMSLGNYDNAGDSYPQDLLTADGFGPGVLVTVNGVDFVMPNVAAGQPDNWKASGQTIAVNAAPGDSVLAFLGAATDTGNHGASGTATIHYSDGSIQNFRLNFTDWLDQNATMPDNLDADDVGGYNTPNGQVRDIDSYLYYTDVGLQAGKTAVSVTLPRTVSFGALHVFAVGTSASTAQTPPYNNTGISADSNNSVGNFDGAHNKYSADALRVAGVTPGSSFTFNNVSFIWPNQAWGAPDNYIAAGQVVPVNSAPAQTRIAFLGSADYGPSFGTATITYVTGTPTTSTIQLGFSDWTLNAGASSPSFGNLKAMTMPYRNARVGHDSHLTYVFYTEFTIPSRGVASVTLPTTVNRGHLHVFAIGTRGAVAIRTSHTRKGYSATGQRLKGPTHLLNGHISKHHTPAHAPQSLHNGHIRKGGKR